MTPGTLFIVSTPIGNLEDITVRAKRVLEEAAIIAAEDTRRTGALLAACGIKNELTSFHSHNARKKTPGLIRRLKSGDDIALVSDSGTPGISDPGSLLIRESIASGVTVSPVPGPTALIAAVIVSGKPAHKFVFEGFLSNRSAKRKKQLERLKDEERTVILYESPHRIIRLLEDFIEVAGDREVVIARELTKKFEEVMRGTACELLKCFSERQPRGEFTVIF